MPKSKKPACIFCALGRKAKAGARHFFSVADGFPVTPGHHLIVSKKHRADLLALSAAEFGELRGLIRKLTKKIRAADPKIKGFNIGANCGAAAGQTIMHFHLHIIPRRKGDQRNPRGGVRGVIPRKQKY